MSKPEEFVDSMHVLEYTMRHFYARALLLKNNNGKPEQIDADLKEAAAIAEKIAPYRHARLSAVKIAGDPNAPKDFEDGATLEELKAMVEFHLERVAPVLNLQVIPINPSEPVGGIANRDAPQGRAGNDAGAPQGQRRANNHHRGIAYRHD